jgi:hypothetical protein
VYPWFSTIADLEIEEANNKANKASGKNKSGGTSNRSNIAPGEESIRKLNIRLRRLVHQGLADIIDPARCVCYIYLEQFIYFIIVGFIFCLTVFCPQYRLYTSSILLSSLTGKVESRNLANKGKARFYTTSVATKAVLGDTKSPSARKFLEQGRGVYSVLPGVVDTYSGRPQSRQGLHGAAGASAAADASADPAKGIMYDILRKVDNIETVDISALQSIARPRSEQQRQSEVQQEIIQWQKRGEFGEFNYIPLPTPQQQQQHYLEQLVSPASQIAVSVPVPVPVGASVSARGGLVGGLGKESLPPSPKHINSNNNNNSHSNIAQHQQSILRPASSAGVYRPVSTGRPYVAAAASASSAPPSPTAAVSARRPHTGGTNKQHQHLRPSASSASASKPPLPKRIDFKNLFGDQPDAGYFPVLKGEGTSAEPSGVGGVRQSSRGGAGGGSISSRGGSFRTNSTSNINDTAAAAAAGREDSVRVVCCEENSWLDEFFQPPEELPAEQVWGASSKRFGVSTAPAAAAGGLGPSCRGGGGGGGGRGGGASGFGASMGNRNTSGGGGGGEFNAAGGGAGNVNGRSSAPGRFGSSGYQQQHLQHHEQHGYSGGGNREAEFYPHRFSGEESVGSTSLISDTRSVAYNKSAAVSFLAF